MVETVSKSPFWPNRQRADGSVRGRRSAMPAPRHEYIIGSQPADAGG